MNILLQQKLDPPLTGESVLPLAEAFLEEPEHHKALRMLECSEEVGFRSVLDFVLCTVCPQFLPACVAFYEGRGPRLDERYSRRSIDRLDQLLVRVLENACRLATAQECGGE